MRVGVDAVEVGRVARWVGRFDAAALGGVFTPAEQAAAQASGRAATYLSVCLAAKEAVAKALGTGLEGIDWTDVEAAVEPSGLRLELRGPAARLAGGLGVRGWLGSWSAPGWLVVVLVVGEAGQR